MYHKATAVIKALKIELCQYQEFSYFHVMACMDKKDGCSLPMNPGHATNQQFSRVIISLLSFQFQVIIIAWIASFLKGNSMIRYEMKSNPGLKNGDTIKANAMHTK
jgi:hypothetical protein